MALFLASLIFVEAHASNRVERRQQIVRIIDQELNEVTRLNRTTGNRNPELLLRMAELLLEKARHIKDAENDRFLRLSVEERQKINRQEFFNRSRQHFVQAQRTCQHILQRFPNFDQKGEVYYIMAYNSKEFQREDEAERYFNMAVREAPRNSDVRAKAQIGLAEIYYNKQDFRRAAPLYEEALKRVDDQWWTKDSFNLAWSYFRIGRQQDAIRLMNQILERSRNSKYVDMSHSVERDLAYFYTEVGDVQQAVQFYEQRGGDMATNLIRVGNHLVGQGKFAAAEKTFREALSHNRTREDNIQIHSQLLSLYERFGNYEKHLESSKILANFYEQGHLQRHQAEDLKYHVQNMSARLQQQVAKGSTDRHDEDRQRRARLAVEYFQLFALLDESQSYQANFHAAETQFATNNFNDAVRLYDLAYKGAQSSGDREIMGHSLEGLMAALGSPGVSESVVDQYIEPAYLAYLRANPRSEESNRIFQRLFNHYLDAGNIENAEKTLNSYNRNFPREEENQEAMIARIMEYYRERGDQAGIQKWVARINAGDFRVSREYADSVRMLLLSMQFDQVEQLTSEGDRKEALRGYLQLYQSEQSSQEVKKNASYNIATLFHELGDAPRTFGWAERSIEHMNNKDVLKFESSYLAMAVTLFEQRHIKEAAALNTKVYNSLCRETSRNKETFFRNANVMHLGLGNRDESRDLIATGRQCGISAEAILDAEAEQLSYLMNNEYWSGLNEYIAQLKNNRKHWPELIFPISKVRDALEQSGRTSQARQKDSEILEIYRGIEKNQDIPLEALDVVADIRMENLTRQFKQLKTIELSFPEQLFNERLEKLFDDLDRMTDTALDVLDVGSGRGIVTGYRYLVEAYQHAGNLILDFTPADQSDSYIESFKQTMSQLANPLIARSREFRQQAMKQIQRGEILSPDTYWFLSKQEHDLRIQYHYPHGGVIMDRGGRR